jgi:PAS domain S-box-containing protein
MQRSYRSQAKTVALDTLPYHVALVDPEGVILTVNEAWRNYARAKGVHQLGLGVGENYLNSYDCDREADSAKAVEATDGIRGVLQGELREFVIEYAQPFMARPKWFRTAVTPIDRSRLHGAMITRMDITLQKTLESNLQRQEAQYLALLNSTREGIFALEERGICTFCNIAAARLLGYEKPRDLVGKVVHQRHCQGRPGHMGEAFKESKVSQAILYGSVSHADNEVFFRVDGTKFPVEYWTHPIYHDVHIVGTVVTFFDITEQLQLRSEFLHAQKTQEIAHLAGGVAHNFKNALAVITGYSELLGERLTADEDGRKYVRQIGVAADRAASFTRQLLGVNRKESVKPVSLDLNSVVLTMDDLLRRMIGEDVILNLTLAPDLARIHADPGHIQQILINLIGNARDAMPQGGEIVIHTSTVQDGYVTLTISDSGCGMDQTVQDRIFEPFFTTKEPGHGTGLGLSTVQQIVMQSKGHIFVRSESGVGTSFEIQLPVFADDTGPILLSPLPRRTFRGTETILVVEDEEAFRTLVSHTLRANGYQVLEAADGTTGIEIAAQCDKMIDLVLTDVVLPDVNGGRVAESLVETNRSAKVLYMSGYTDDYITSLGVDIPETGFLEKPFDIQVMLAKVRETLDQTPANFGVTTSQPNPLLGA